MKKSDLYPSFLERLYLVVVLTIFGGIVLHAPLSVFLGTLLPDYAEFIKAWKEILMLLLIPVAIVVATRRRLWASLFSDWVFHIVLAYTALHLATVGLLYQGAAATAAGLAIDLRYVLFFALVYVLIRSRPELRRLFVTVGIVGASIVTGFATLQLFLPADFLRHIGYGPNTIMPYMTVDENHDYIRISSTLRGPNPLGAYAGVVLALITAAFVRGKFAARSRRLQIGVALLVACSLIALWFNYSRSALVAGLGMIGLVFALTKLRQPTRRAWLVGGIVSICLVAGLALSWNSSFVSNVILHDNPTSGAAVTSNDGHVDSLREGTIRLIEQPLGAGVGSTGSASLQGEAPIIIENQYLFVAHETGWIGLALFLLLFSLIMVRLWRARQDWLALGIFASGVGLAAIGVLLPVWVDDTVSIIWWGLAAVALAGRRS